MVCIVLVGGPSFQRRTLTWVAVATLALGGLKLLIRDAAESTQAILTTEVSQYAPTVTRLPSLPYTVRARRVVAAAQQEAFRRAQPAYDQEDLRLAIAVVPESAGLVVLDRLGVSQGRLRAEAESVIAAAPGQPSGPPSVSVNVNVSSLAVRAAPRAQAMLALAVDEALLLRHAYLGVEHLLLAMLRQGAGPGYDALARLGVRLEPARAALRAYIAQTWRRRARAMRVAAAPALVRSGCNGLGTLRAYIGHP
jgi:hypothetical protein